MQKKIRCVYIKLSFPRKERWISHSEINQRKSPYLYSKGQKSSDARTTSQQMEEKTCHTLQHPLTEKSSWQNGFGTKLSESEKRLPFFKHMAYITHKGTHLNLCCLNKEQDRTPALTTALPHSTWGLIRTVRGEKSKGYKFSTGRNKAAFCLQITFWYNCNSKESMEEPLELIIIYLRAKTNTT